MIEVFKRLFADVTTTRSGAFDVVRCGMILSGLALIGLSGWAVVVNKQPFDALAFGGGAAAIFAGGGFGIAQKRSDEPDA
jgi:hypothetical protein